jgi:hypothetical protein
LLACPVSSGLCAGLPEWKLACLERLPGGALCPLRRIRVLRRKIETKLPGRAGLQDRPTSLRGHAGPVRPAGAVSPTASKSRSGLASTRGNLTPTQVRGGTLSSPSPSMGRGQGVRFSLCTPRPPCAGLFERPWVSSRLPPSHHPQRVLIHLALQHRDAREQGLQPGFQVLQRHALAVRVEGADHRHAGAGGSQHVVVS